MGTKTRRSRSRKRLKKIFSRTLTETISLLIPSFTESHQMSTTTRSRHTGRVGYRISFFLRRLILQVQIADEQARTRDLRIYKAPPGCRDPDSYREHQLEKAFRAWSVKRTYWRDATEQDLEQARFQRDCLRNRTESNKGD